MLATNPTLLSLAAAHGVPAAPVGPPVDMGEAGARLMAQSFNNIWIGMLRVMQLGGQTGYWFARQPSGWTPPPDLVEFIRAGEKPLAVSLGVMSQSGKQARRGAELVLAALDQAGGRAIVQGWNAVLSDLSLPETVFHAGSLPHSWMFEQVWAVIHHGGFGTTAAGLRAGVPAVVIPYVIDQFYWAQRVYELGAGPKFIPRGQLNAEKLTAAILQCRQDDALRRQADKLGNQIRAEPDGVCAAVQAIENLVLSG